MEVSEVQKCFNRAISKAISTKKVMWTAASILACALLFVFFQAIALTTGIWMKISLTFIPFLLSLAILLACGIVLVRMYHNEVKDQPGGLKEVVEESLGLVSSGLYFFMPFILIFVVLWLAIGFFYMIGSLPAIGPLLSVAFAGVPFLINLAIVLLLILSVISLFFVTPVMALRGIDRDYLQNTLIQRILADPFSHFQALIVTLIPVYVVYYILVTALNITTLFLNRDDSVVYMIIGWFSVCIPFSTLFAPVIIFFFNMAAEVHVLLKSKAGD